MTNTYESVYSTHKDNEVATRGSYSYEPERDAQGTAIERVKAYARTEISNEDGTTMNCGIFTDLMYVCNYISDVEHIKERRVYMALCTLGRDRCCSEFQTNGSDVFTDISRLMSVGRRAVDDPLKMKITRTHVPIFDDIHTKKFRTSKQILAKSVDRANECAVKTSHMNLYYTLVGVKYLVENDPDYILFADTPLFTDVLRPLLKVDKILSKRRDMIFNIMHDNPVLCDDWVEEMYLYDEKFIQTNIDVSSIGLEFVEYEYQMDIGRVDILCKSDDEFVLVEVKKGIAGTDAIGQVLKYVCTFNELCKGMIIAEEFNKQVVNAANKLHIDLVEYTTWLDDDMRRRVKIHRL